MSIVPAPEEAEIVEIGEGFVERSFPAARFHHREHLIMTTFLLTRHPSRDWRSELPDLIRSYNLANGGVNDDSRGYHHTITMAFLALVEGIVAEVGRDDLVGACAAVVDSPLMQQDVLLRFYSRDRLLSREARLGWLEPDLAPIGLQPIMAG